ncbi:MAG: MBL fold metallo-hydrolase [Defluviitaleaceae bacterium]|nr:MBL fold metallo-hydrolase [Defluviitaleaceae bacterium]
MKIAENVAMLPITIEVPDREAPMNLNMTLTWDEKNLVLMDAAVPEQSQVIAKLIADEGFDVKNLTHIIITHQDMDHIGSVLELLKLAPNAKVLAHVDEAPHMDGRKTPIRLAGLLAQYDSMPPEAQAQFDEYKKAVDAGQFRLKIDQELTDKEVLPICGGIEVVHTPGHMPGHIALFLRESSIMVCGDAANIADGAISGPNPVHTPDMDEAMKSLEKIKGYPLKGIVAYHGGYLEM